MPLDFQYRIAVGVHGSRGQVARLAFRRCSLVVPGGSGDPSNLVVMRLDGGDDGEFKDDDEFKDARRMCV